MAWCRISEHIPENLAHELCPAFAFKWQMPEDAGDEILIEIEQSSMSAIT